MESTWTPHGLHEIHLESRWSPAGLLSKSNNNNSITFNNLFAGIYFLLLYLFIYLIYI